ncbi:MAG: virulence RhuM family protein [Phycisphaerae bacterium]|nr:virulence RhuM family protein [Phycisphaerae bacterium]
MTMAPFPDRRPAGGIIGLIATTGTLFGVDIRTISEHLRNIFSSGELQQDSVIRKFRNTALDDKSYNTKFYNLDAIISVGYRVNSTRAPKYACRLK